MTQGPANKNLTARVYDVRLAWGILESSSWIGKVYGAESEIYSCHEQNLQNIRINHGPFLMNFNSRAMTTHLLTILFATCSVAFTLFLYFSTLLLWLFVCTCRFSSGRRFSSSRHVIWIKTITIITVVCVYIVSTAITYKRTQELPGMGF